MPEHRIWSHKRDNRVAYSLIRSFGYALRGITYALTRERNLRIHFAAGAFALFISGYYSLSVAEMGLLLLCVGFVVTCEMVNTAIEKTVDLEAAQYNRLAGIAKDVAAGAVLVSALTSTAVGFLLFWKPPVMRRIAADIAANPIPWIAAAVVAAVCIACPRREK